MVDSPHLTDEFPSWNGRLLVERPRSLSDGVPLEKLRFELQTVWRDVMPYEEPFAADNCFCYYRSRMYGELFDSSTNHFSTDSNSDSELYRSTSDGVLTVENTTAAEQIERLGIHRSPPGPHFSILTDISAWSGRTGASSPGIGLIKDENDYASIELSPQTGRILSRRRVEGSTIVDDFGSVSVTPPISLLAMFAGSVVYCFVRERDTGWSFVGKTTFKNIDLYDTKERESWELALQFRLGNEGSVSCTDLAVLQTPQIGVRDPTVVTYRDGAPFVRDGYAYFLCTCGLESETSYQGIFRIDLSTYDVEFTAALYSESTEGYAYPDLAGHALYDDQRDEFCVFFSGYGTRDHGGDSKAYTYVTRTGVDILHGTHVLPTDRAQLPGPGGHRDPFVIYDDSAGAWRCFHEYNGVDEVAVSETRDDSFRTDWSVVASRASTDSNMEGCKITHVNGEYKLVYKDTDTEYGFVSADYPDPSKNVTPITVDVPTGHHGPHPMVMPVRDGDQTKYLMLSMDIATAFGLGKYSYGALYVYEADRRADGHEFPLRTVIR